VEELNNQLLSGVRVIDLTRVLAGPYCTMTLGDLGADVIKIESPNHGDDTRHWGPPFVGGESAYFLSVNRNKRSLTLDLKSDKGLTILKNLIKHADILVDNFKTDTLKKWGLSQSKLNELKPDLIYCTITGYGYSGPFMNRPGYDFIIQALGGIMSITGPEDGAPYKVGVAITDITAGQNAAIAILAALYSRNRTGRGERIDISLFDSQIAWLANVASNYLISGENPKKYGNAHPNIVPYQVFEASDALFAFAIGNDRQWKIFCREVNRSFWANDKQFATNSKRVENRAQLIPLMEKLFATQNVDYWLKKFEKSGILSAPINTIEGAINHPQTIARELIEKTQHPTAGEISIIASPLHISGTRLKMRFPPPFLGQHSREILKELGYSDVDCDNFQKQDVI